MFEHDKPQAVSLASVFADGCFPSFGLRRDADGGQLARYRSD